MLLWENDPEISYFDDNAAADTPAVTSRQMRQRLRRAMQPLPQPSIMHYAIHKRGEQTFIGFGMIAFIDPYNRTCRLGIEIGEKSEWGKGYAHEALQAVIDYCFTTLDMNRVGAEVYAFNERSIHLFEGLGFRREGAVRESVRKGDTFFDEYLYGLLRCEWRPEVT